MMFVVLDLEWNTAFSAHNKKYLNEIIEFGAVKLDGDLNEVDSFSMLVKPQVGKTLTGMVEELTHISNEDLSGGGTFTHVLSKFKKFAEGCVLLTWGHMDILALIANCQYFLKSERLDFAQWFVDLQKYCERCFNFQKNAKQIGLSKAAQTLEIEFDEQVLHRALNDSRLEAECFKRLYQKSEYNELFPQMLHEMDEEFYKKLLFKTVPITDINDPKIDKNEFAVSCKKCGGQMEQKSKWKVVNNAFRAHFYCKKCSLNFEANVRFRLKYEGVSVHKYMRRIIKEDSAAQAQKKAAAKLETEQ